MKLTGVVYDGPVISYEVDAARVGSLRRALNELVECGIPFMGFEGLGGAQLTTEPFESGETGRMVVGITLALPRVALAEKAEPSRLILQ